MVPLILTVLVVIADQITKFMVVSNINLGEVKYALLGDFIWICHVRNNAIGFSLGANFAPSVKLVLFIIVPLIILLLLIFFVIKNREFTLFQRWMVAGIIGGGFGNIIDRIFRAESVVDFISVKVYGLFGYERWPTFNVADMTIVVCTILLMLSLIFVKTSEGKK